METDKRREISLGTRDCDKREKREKRAMRRSKGENPLSRAASMTQLERRRSRNQ
jgi:hypothetical protein